MAADDHAEIALLKKRLAELDVEREGLLASLEQLQQRNNADAKLSSQALNAASAATARSNAEKVTLFRSLFRGRDDVFPLRWENSNSGKAGYSPECHNEWVRGICEKPRVRRLSKPGLRSGNRRHCKKSSSGKGPREPEASFAIRTSS